MKTLNIYQIGAASWKARQGEGETKVEWDFAIFCDAETKVKVNGVIVDTCFTTTATSGVNGDFLVKICDCIFK